MTSETSAVIVAVRVRPFSSREDPAACTITVPDPRTITISDVPALLPGSSSAASTTVSTSAAAAGASELGKHSYTFDRIFWSVQSDVLPLSLPALLHRNSDSSASVTSRPRSPASTSSGNSTPTARSLSTTQQKLRHMDPATAMQYPCFAQPPAYEGQAGVYDFVGPRMAEAAMSGFNTCLFAYGQTGSGKSYSMMGPADKLSRQDAEEMGIIPRLSEELFRLMRAEREAEESVSYTVELSFLEIYCERVRDLLSGGSGGSGSGQLRIRQHPTRGPYVEGLSHVKVRDAAGVMKYLDNGLRDRATAETKMNEHSSRSHAMLQLHITKVTVTSDSNGVLTKTRVCKVNMVDLAGSERVTQSGATGERFEEARNINLSLSTLGRVIQQLSEKQAGKSVMPAYRDSVLTWLLSDSLGGNSKTLMLATIAPSAYCYQQTLNTLRFAGVTKRIVNVATVNEDQHFQQLIAELRQQIVRLTLQLESGKASEMQREEIRVLKAEREDLQAENDMLRARAALTPDPAVVQTLKRRVAELEDENGQLRSEKLSLQQRLLSSTTALREELARVRAEALQLQETLASKEAEWSARARERSYVKAAQRQQQAVDAITGAAVVDTKAGAGTNAATAMSAASPRAELERRGADIVRLKRRIHTLAQEAETMKRARDEAVDAAAAQYSQLDDLQVRYDENHRQMDALRARVESTMALLESTQCKLAATSTASMSEAARAQTVMEAREALLATQLEETRQSYLGEKKSNVQLLLRVTEVEQERSRLKKAVAEKQADVSELEQLLMEETEASERSYMRMRYYRNVSEMQRQLTSQLMHSHKSSASRSPAIYNVSTTSPMTTVNGSFLTPSATPRGHDSPALVTPVASSAALDIFADSSYHNRSYELVFAQLEYECLCDEAQRRGSVERDEMDGITRLLAQKARLQREELVALGHKLLEAQEALTQAEEDSATVKARSRELEREAEAELQRRVAASGEAQVSEMERMRLARRLRTLEESNEDLERERDTLIKQLADAQSVHAFLELRCTEVERLAVSTQEAIMAGGTGGDVNEASTMELGKESELLRVSAELQQVTAQCETYREELGTLRAQTERDSAAFATKASQLVREKEQLQEQLRTAEHSNVQLVAEVGDVGRDFEQRVQQQREMITTLRLSLEEETAMADACREATQRAEAARNSAEEELAVLRDSCDELRRSQRQYELQCDTIQQELDELRLQYTVLEKQLVELQDREPELYLMMEKGTAEDTSAWLDKARREKANLMKQKLEARRINAELLEHVRKRNVQLRDVQRRHLTDSSFATYGADSTASTDLDKTSHRGHMDSSLSGSIRPSPQSDEYRNAFEEDGDVITP